MPQQNPITRLREIQLGLGRLAKEYETTTGEKPANLIWWNEQLGEVIEELQARGTALEEASETPHGA